MNIPRKTEQHSTSIVYDEVHPFGYHGGTFADYEFWEAYCNNRPLKLDMSIPGRCRNSCNYCGYYEVNSNGKLSPAEISNILHQWKDIGGKGVVIVGEGEPLLRPDIFDLLSCISDLCMIPVIFTCGDVIGDDRLSAMIHKGISGMDVAQRLEEIGCTVMLKFESWSQDDIVGRQGYSLVRNEALKILMNLSFNTHYPTRLGFGSVLLKRNIGEIPDMFRFALSNNLYPLICPLMPIGRCKEERWRESIAPTKEEVKALITILTEIRAEYGIPRDIVSDFPGGLPCDISRAGLYCDDIGNISLCESDEPVGNVKEKSLVELWKDATRRKDEKYGKLRCLGLCSPKRYYGIV